MAFKFLELPQELQDLVYRKYFEEGTLFIDEIFSSSASFRHSRLLPLPSLSIEQVSKRVSRDARGMRHQLWRHLEIRHGVDTLGRFIEAPKFAWIRKNITSIAIRNTDIAGSWRMRSFGSLAWRCPQLRYIRVQLNGSEHTPYDAVLPEWAVSTTTDDSNLSLVRHLFLPQLAACLAAVFQDDYGVVAETMVRWVDKRQKFDVCKVSCWPSICPALLTS